jgi:F-box/leucine-rich repeat protein 4
MVDADKLVLFDASNSDDTDIVLIEQFVRSVDCFSSQYGSDFSISYTAYNITGKPSKFPEYGDFSNAFVMVSYTRV